MKILFLDADGTLLHHEGYIPQSALRACQIAQTNGHKIILCTGRQLVEIYGDMLKIDYDGLITGSGAHVEVHGQVLEEKTFQVSQIKRLLDYFQTYQIDALFETTHGLVGTADTQKHLIQMIDKQCRHLSKELYDQHGLVQVFRNLRVTDSILNQPVNKISFLESERTYAQIKADLGNDFDLVPATFAPFGTESGEISEKSITKATGMKSILNYYQTSIDDTVAIGDSFNDLCMFELANTSIAMGNAPEKVKEKADHVTTCLDDDGIWNAFTSLHLIESESMTKPE